MRRAILAAAAIQCATITWPLAGTIAYITTRHTLASQRHAIAATIAAELENA